MPTRDIQSRRWRNEIFQICQGEEGCNLKSSSGRFPTFSWKHWRRGFQSGQTHISKGRNIAGSVLSIFNYTQFLLQHGLIKSSSETKDKNYLVTQSYCSFKRKFQQEEKFTAVILSFERHILTNLYKSRLFSDFFSLTEIILYYIT